MHAQSTSPTSEVRQEAKYSLTKALRDSGRSRVEIRDLYRLIDWILNLSPKLAQIFHERITAYEKENNMPPYITSLERTGIRKGLEKGLEKGREQGLEQGLEKGRERGLAESLRVVLEARFGAEAAALSGRLQNLSLAGLEALLPLAATVDSLEEFAAQIPSD